MSKQAARKTSAKSSVPLVPQPHGGALQIGNPGNKGGGRKPDHFMERAEELVNDPMVWDVQHARAKAGDLKVLEFAAHYVKGKPKEHTEYSGELTIKVQYDDE